MAHMILPVHGAVLGVREDMENMGRHRLYPRGGPVRNWGLNFVMQTNGMYQNKSATRVRNSNEQYL